MDSIGKNTRIRVFGPNYLDALLTVPFMTTNGTAQACHSQLHQCARLFTQPMR